MLSLNKFFDHPRLIAFTSDSSVDYTLNEASPFLTNLQTAALAQSMGASFNDLAWVKQIHGADVLVVDEEFFKQNDLNQADALVSHSKNVVIAVRTADCLPVFLWDPVHEVMAVVHAGWKSTQKEILKRTLEVMWGRFNTDYKDLSIAFGPAIRSCCYQVSDEFKTYFPDATEDRDGQLYMDLIKANRDQLSTLGIEREQLFDCRQCTVCSPGYFSYRRDGDKSGRMLSGMLLKG